jgi:hypothetical protein
VIEPVEVGVGLQAEIEDLNARPRRKGAPVIATPMTLRS